MTPDIKAIREDAEQAEKEYGVFKICRLPPATVKWLCDLIDTLQADCNDERGRRMALLEELEKQHDEIERLRKDAARYQWLREQHWNDDVIGVLVRPKTHSQLGSLLPSLELLDSTIDHMMKANP